MKYSEVCVPVRARDCGAFAVAIFAVVIATAVPAHADEIPSPEPTVEVIDQPALPAGPIPSIEPSVPEGTFDPAPTEPVPTAVPTVAPPAPVGTSFESTRPDGTSVELFRSGDATTTYRGTGNGVPRDTAPAPQAVEPEGQPTEVAPVSPTPATASPTPGTATASPSPDVARGDSAGPGAAVRSTSAPRTPAPPLPFLILGMVVLVGGLLIVRYRGPVYEAAMATRRGPVTGGAGERAGGLQGAFRLGVAGAVVALIGIIMNGYAAWQLWSALSS